MQIITLKKKEKEKKNPMQNPKEVELQEIEENL